MKMATPIGPPGGVGWLNEKLFYQDIDQLYVVKCRFDSKRAELVVKKPYVTGYLYDLRTVSRDKLLSHPAVQMMSLPPSIGEGIFFWGVKGIGSSDVTSLNLSQPRDVFPPQGTDAICLDGTGICAIGPEHTRYMPKPWSEWKTGPHPLGGAPVQYSGLVYLPHSGTYLTLLSSCGEGLEFKLKAGSRPEIVARYTAVTDHPFDIDYDPDMDVLWISDPAERSIFRVKFEAFKNSRFPDKEIPPGAREVSGEIKSDVTWKAGDIVANSTVTIEKNARLIIEPGARVHFASGAGILIKGTLRAQGHEDKPVVFDSLRAGEFWRGITSGSGASILMDNCIFERSRVGLSVDSPAALEIFSTKFKNVPGSAVRVTDLTDELRRLVVRDCFFDGIGGAAVSIEGIDSDLERKMEIQTNFFSKVGTAVVLKAGPSKLGNTFVELAGNIVRFARRTVFDFHGGGGQLELQISDNVITNGSELADCLKISNASGAMVKRNYFFLCRSAAIEIVKTPANIESNAFEGSRTGIIIRAPKGNILIKNNEARNVDMAVGSEAKPEKSAPFKLTLGGNLWGKGFYNPLKPMEIRLETLGKNVIFNSDAETSRAAAFLSLVVVSGLTGEPVPGHEVMIVMPNRVTPVKFYANMAGRYAGSLPPGNYNLQAKGGLGWRKVVLESGKLTDLRLTAP